MGQPGRSGKKRKLTSEQERDLLELCEIHRRTHPKILAAKFGISQNTINSYVRRSRMEAGRAH